MARLDVRLQRHRPHAGFEIKQPRLADAQPVGQVLRVAQGRGKPYNSNRHAGLRADVAHAGDDDLKDGATIGAQQVDLIDHDQADLG